MRVNQFLFVYILHNLRTTQANCQPRCELTNRPTTDTRLANRALVGHSSKNFTVNKQKSSTLLIIWDRTRLNLESMLQHKSTIAIPFFPYKQLITMRVIQFLLVFILHNLNTTQANCQERCEQTKGRTTDTGLTNRALLGHSFKNFTVDKPFDCHLLCFVEKCRCQAYQMKGKHGCELFEEERFAARNDLVEEKEYEYYDTSREYEKAVRYCQFEDNLSYKDGLSSFNWSIKGVENTDSYIAPFRLLLHIQ